MSSNDPRDPRNVPQSPDHLELRGPVGGVTRIGPRAFALALAVICAIVLIVIYGVNKTSGTRTTETAATTANVSGSPAPNPFATAPIVATPAPSAEPVPLLEPPTPVPNVEPRQIAAPAAPAAAPANPAGSANDAAERAAQMQREQQAEQARQEAEKARRERIAAAYRSQILAGNGEQAGSGLGSGGGLAFAGNGGGAPAQLAAQAAGALSGGGNTGFAGSAGGGGGANGLMGRGVPANVPLGADPTPDPNAFLAGPVGQYGSRNGGEVGAASVSQTTGALPANANSEDYLSSGRTAARSAYQLTAGTVIPAALVTGLDSEIPGIVIGQVREDVYDTRTGKYKLIPRGTRLVGVYKSGVAYGQSRVLVTWRRMIFPDTTNVDLENFSGNDQEGFAGFGGTVDNHTGRIVGAALLSSVITAAFELTQRNSTNSVLQVPSAGQAAGQAVGQQVTQVTNNLIQKQLNIPPVVYVPKGYPFLVVVDRDVVFPGPYRDL